MSLSSSLSNALSGLTASARSAEVIASNISNAMTEGYARREIQLSARSGANMGGVYVEGISRQISLGILGDRRIADAQLASASTTTDFLAWVETAMGNPDEAGSLSSFLAEFESRLVVAAADPGSTQRLEQTLDTARMFVEKTKSVSDGIQEQRAMADAKILRSVNDLNTWLEEIREINTQIVKAGATRSDTSSLEDNRQKLVDQVSELVPVREVMRDSGAIALFTTGGTILLETSASTIEFSQTNVILPHMTLADGDLSGLTIDGRALSTRENGPLGDGKLAALFNLRDTLAVETQAQVDAMARDLVERFQDPAVDPTLGAGDAGLFTDDGGAFDPLDEVGLAGRLSLNALVDPMQGGEAWRLRDGLGAAIPGNVGSDTLLKSLRQALNTTQVPASGSFGSNALTTKALVSELVSGVGVDRNNAETRQSYIGARQYELRSQELSLGVDTDQELQNMLLVEQVYAANAKVISTVDEMLQAIMSI